MYINKVSDRINLIQLILFIFFFFDNILSFFIIIKINKQKNMIQFINIKKNK
jgi:hypothetical protein